VSLRLKAAALACVVILAASPVGAGEIARLKAACPNGAVVDLRGVITALFGHCCYIEDPDGEAGIKLLGFDGYVGIDYCLSGVMQTGFDGERVVRRDPMSPVASAPGEFPPIPLLANRCVGGGDFFYDRRTGRGQKGVHQGKGPNNIGLIIRTGGTVTFVDKKKFHFYVNDGTARADGSGKRGLKVSYADFGPGGPYLIPRVGSVVEVTGISTVFSLRARMQSMIRLRCQRDIRFLRF